MNREKKIISLKEAVSKIKNNSVLGLSGFSYMNPPMALVREVIKKKVKNLTLISGPTSGIETDILIGAGCVKKVISACVAFEKIIGVAPNFRKFSEKNEIEAWECDESIWHIALKAGIYNMPYMLWPGAVGTSIPELNKEIKEVEVKGKKYLQVPSIKLDTAIIHFGLGDELGNVQYPKNIFLGRNFCERELAEAAKDVIVTVEKIMPNEEMVNNAERTIIRNADIVKAEFGAHPGACNGFYIPDLEHYRDYVKFCKENKFDKYLDKYVYDVDFDNYKDLIGKKKLESLKLIQ
jgi:glutaconate CoA-transferase subunit A